MSAELNGVDPARQALIAAWEAARKHGNTPGAPFGAHLSVCSNPRPSVCPRHQREAFTKTSKPEMPWPGVTKHVTLGAMNVSGRSITATARATSSPVAAA